MVTNVGESVAAACEKHKADITIIFSGHVIVLYIFARTFSLQLHSSVSCSVIVLICVYLNPLHTNRFKSQVNVI